METRDPITAEAIRHAAVWRDPLLHTARLVLEAVGMRRVLASGLSSLGLPPDRNMPHRMLDAACGSDNALEQADRMLALVAETCPDEFRAHFWRGIVRLERGDPAQASPHFERAGAWFSGSALAFLYAARIHRTLSWRGREVPLLTAAVAAARDLHAARRRLADIRRTAAPAEAAAHYVAMTHYSSLPLYGRSLREAQEESRVRLGAIAAGDVRRDPPLTDGGDPPRIRPLRRDGTALDQLAQRAFDAALTDPPLSGSPAGDPDRVYVLPLYHVGHRVARWRGRFYAVDWRIRFVQPEHLDPPTPSADTLAGLERLLAQERRESPPGLADQSTNGGRQP